MEFPNHLGMGREIPFGKPKFIENMRLALLYSINQISETYSISVPILILPYGNPI
jgi:hypothetical protein